LEEIKDLDSLIGKTIKEVRGTDSEISFTFTDKTKIKIIHNGVEEACLEMKTEVVEMVPQRREVDLLGKGCS